jgi:hypothetical protein
MAKSNWNRVARVFKKHLAEKNRRRRPRKPAKLAGVIYVQGNLSDAALARMTAAGVRIVRREPNA